MMMLTRVRSTRESRPAWPASVAFVLAMAAVPLGVVRAAATNLAAPPNIIVVMADDLGWTDLSTGRTNLGHGSDYYETPHIDQMADEGLVFTSYRTQPNCAPTRAALLSGQYAAHGGNGVYNVNSLNRGSRKRKSRGPLLRPEIFHAESRLIPPSQRQDIPASTYTIAEALADAGYVTAHFGKYHVGGHTDGTLPEDQGFAYNFGGCNRGNQARCFAKQTSQGWTFEPFIGRRELDPFAGPYTAAYLQQQRMPASLEGTPKHITDAMGDALLNFLDQYRQGPNRKRPFYIQFHTYAVHGPHQPRPDYKQHFSDKKPGSRHQNVNYAAFISSLDRAVGRLLDYLRDPNADGDLSDSLAANTLVLFTSDNGGSNGTTNVPLRRNKGTFYDGGLRVPLIAWRPGTVPQRTASNILIHSVDFYPTFVEIAAAKLPEEKAQLLDGESFASVLADPRRDRPRRRPICYYFPGYMDTRAWPLAVTIQEIEQHRYKLMYSYETGFYELYDLTRDIGEQVNLADVEHRVTYRPLANRMIGALNRWLMRDDPTWAPARLKDKKTGAPVPLAVPEL